MNIAKKDFGLILGGRGAYSILQKNVGKREGQSFVLNLDCLIERGLDQVLVLLVYIESRVFQGPQETAETIRIAFLDQRQDSLIGRNTQSRVAWIRRVPALRDHLLVE